MRTSIIAAALALASLGACTPLTANAPLFTTADSVGPPPLMEGRWVALDEEKCTRAMALRRGGPAHGCQPFTLRRTEDGAWQFYAEGDDEHGVHHTMNLRFVMAPATGKATPEAYAPLYVAEYASSSVAEDPPETSAAPADKPPPNQVQYAVLAPIGTLPAREVFTIAEIDCDAALREGPIDGVSEPLNADGSSHGCVAANQQAVREAARRVLINNIARVDSSRMVYIGP